MIRRKQPTRTELVERKHLLEGEITTLRAELRRRRRRKQDTAEIERRLARAQQRHYETRLEIDRTATETRSDD